MSDRLPDTERQKTSGSGNTREMGIW